MRASTWGGDVSINSNDTFGSHGYDLASVLLHEAGHVFGLAGSPDPNSPLYSQYTGAQQLTSNDIANLQALYGTRSLDPHEGSNGNDSMSSATQIQFPGQYTGTTPLVTFGDISTNKDVDFYALRPPSNYNGPITFQLDSAGISLLTTKLTVMDQNGNVIAHWRRVISVTA